MCSLKSHDDNCMVFTSMPCTFLSSMLQIVGTEIASISMFTKEHSKKLRSMKIVAGSLNQLIHLSLKGIALFLRLTQKF